MAVTIAGTEFQLWQIIASSIVLCIVIVAVVVFLYSRRRNYEQKVLEEINDINNAFEIEKVDVERLQDTAEDNGKLRQVLIDRIEAQTQKVKDLKRR